MVKLYSDPSTVCTVYMYKCRFLYLFLTAAEQYVLADTFGALMAVKLIRVLTVFKSELFMTPCAEGQTLASSYIHVPNLGKAKKVEFQGAPAE